MGYKRAGFNVIGNVEIDPRINKLYIKNLHPKYNFLMDLREFNKLDDLPDELYQLDILDGSPPCTTFSTAGLREKTWGKEKTFREGQKKQRLDDLFFVFLDTVEKLKPKIVIAENVTGLIKGNAKGYVNEIIKRFKSIGYDVQLFKLNAAKMDVPQNRERVFFIANRMNYQKLKLSFNGKSIFFKDVRSLHGKSLKGEITKELLKHLKKNDRDIGAINKRIKGKESGFTRKIIWDDMVCLTVVSGGQYIRVCDKSTFSNADFTNVSSFPQDYDFINSNVQYVVGMCVPPNMMANIANEIWKQWLKGEIDV